MTLHDSKNLTFISKKEAFKNVNKKILAEVNRQQGFSWNRRIIFPAPATLSICFPGPPA